MRRVLPLLVLLAFGLALGHGKKGPYCATAKVPGTEQTLCSSSSSSSSPSAPEASTAASFAAPVLIRNVQRSFYNVTRERTKFKVSGHVVVLKGGPQAAEDFFAVLPPLYGCGAGRGSTVDALARAFVKRRHQRVSVHGKQQEQEQELFVTSSVFGCRAATNAGLYNTRSFSCHGHVAGKGGGFVVAAAGDDEAEADDVVAGFVSHYDSNIASPANTVFRDKKTLAHFGLVRSRRSSSSQSAGSASSSFLAGYLSPEEEDALEHRLGQQEAQEEAVRDFIVNGAVPESVDSKGEEEEEQSRRLGDSNTKKRKSRPSSYRFSALVAGYLWLVRDGKPLIGNGNNAASAVAPERLEDSGIQETGTSDYFLSVSSGRTAVGWDRDGNLVIAQIDGKSDWNGLDLATFASWLSDEAGPVRMVAAINLDGGASATFVREGTVANLPSYSCLAAGAAQYGRGAYNLTADEKGEIGADAAAASPKSASPLASPTTARADDPNFRCVRPVSSALCIHDHPVPVPAHVTIGGPLQPASSFSSAAAGRSLRRKGKEQACLCFHEKDVSIADAHELSKALLDPLVGAVDDDAPSSPASVSPAESARRLGSHATTTTDEVVKPVDVWLPEPLTTEFEWMKAQSLVERFQPHLRLRGADPTCICKQRSETAVHLMLHRYSYHNRLRRWHLGLRELFKRVQEVEGSEAGLGTAAVPSWPFYSGEVNSLDYKPSAVKPVDAAALLADLPAPVIPASPVASPSAVAAKGTAPSATRTASPAVVVAKEANEAAEADDADEEEQAQPPTPPVQPSASPSPSRVPAPSKAKVAASSSPAARSSTKPKKTGSPKKSEVETAMAADKSVASPTRAAEGSKSAEAEEEEGISPGGYVFLVLWLGFAARMITKDRCERRQGAQAAAAATAVLPRPPPSAPPVEPSAMLSPVSTTVASLQGRADEDEQEEDPDWGGDDDLESASFRRSRGGAAGRAVVLY